ncbi:MAG: hypothetical protein ABI534_11025 [Chloroflexota bacterium]
MSSFRWRRSGTTIAARARRRLFPLLGRCSSVALAAWVAVSTGGGFPH